MLDSDNADAANAGLDLIKTAFSELFDFPLTLPQVQTLDIAGTMKLVPADASVVTKQDFQFYDLSAEFAVDGPAGIQILHCAFADSDPVQNNARQFSFSDTVLRNTIASDVFVRVKALDGTPLWSRAYDPGDPRLASLSIEVPLQRPGTLIAGKDNVRVAGKKLRGQVLELSKKCPLRDLTVVLQAKSDGDAAWRIVGAATTDSAGNFSMPYPFGIFTAAQALVSATPDSPAPVHVTSVRKAIRPLPTNSSTSW